MIRTILNVFNVIYDVTMIAIFIFFVLYTIRKWQIFKEAGVSGWKSLIPIYSDWILF
jgi:hypothetical protein